MIYVIKRWKTVEGTGNSLMLNDEDVRFYRENGYLMVENAVTPEQLSRMRERTLQLIEGSRSVTESDDLYDLDEGHSVASIT